MDRNTIKQFLETLHFHGYIDHDITKIDDLIDNYYPKDTLVTGSEEFSDNALICFVPDDLKNEIKHLWSIPNDGYNPRVRALKKTRSFFKEKGFELSIKKAESIMKKIRES